MASSDNAITYEGAIVPDLGGGNLTTLFKYEGCLRPRSCPLETMIYPVYSPPGHIAVSL